MPLMIPSYSSNPPFGSRWGQGGFGVSGKSTSGGLGGISFLSRLEKPYGTRVSARKRRGTSLGRSFYTRDHLGSIRELVDMSQTVRARYDYDPFGRVTKVSGDRDSVFLYTGHFWHAQSGLYLTLYRAYDSNLGRWLSRDPIAEGGGLNLYAYVGNNPISFIDPLGLSARTFWTNFAWGLGSSIVIGALFIALAATAPITATILGVVLLVASLPNLVNSLDRLSDPCVSEDEKDGILGNLLGAAVGAAATMGAGAGLRGTPALSAAESGMVGDASALTTAADGPVQGPSPNINGSQGKHIASSNNYIPGRSILTADPVELGRSAGTGSSKNGIPQGTPGAKEGIDFGFTIGEYWAAGATSGVPTTNGMVIYSGSGIHIVPIRPNP